MYALHTEEKKSEEKARKEFTLLTIKRQVSNHQFYEWDEW